MEKDAAPNLSVLKTALPMSSQSQVNPSAGFPLGGLIYFFSYTLGLPALGREL